ncbi:ATP synthase F1 subunit epsilon [Clostridium bornimense]|uniref:ATP synthase F1 subunit epsilon n=1 Tax=Clostridium bornimense TaxID=1216932 RepID=UPI001C0FBE03|nr:ATP synthase F1 subunit epsilon [Clostridium bornimense]MBU5314933.1 ATP synthase F1 subunit epsilon [Clostridium bornimense]
MNKKFHLTIVTPDNIYFEGEVEELMVTTENGPVGILANRLSIITAVVPSVTTYYDDENKKVLFTSSGVFKFRDNKAVLMVEACESKEEIDKNRAEKALERSKNRLKEHSDKVNVARAKMAMARAIGRLNLVDKY